MPRAKKSKSKRGKNDSAKRGKAVKKNARKSSRKKLIPPRPEGSHLGWRPEGSPLGWRPEGSHLGWRTLEIHNEHADNRPWVLDTQQKQVEKIVAAAKRGAVSADNCFVYFAAFDGTNNDEKNVGNFQTTNVRQLWCQYEPGLAQNPNLGGSYFAGPGTKGTLTSSAWKSAAVTGQVTKTANKAYKDFAAQASSWLQENPPPKGTSFGAPPKRTSFGAQGSLSVVLTSFSRGIASAAIFTQLLDKKGLAVREGRRKKKLKVAVSAGINFDPVATGVKSNIAFAANSSNIVNLRAQDEYRQLFKAVDFSAQKAIVTTIPMLGNHCDIGGGYASYDSGLAALALEAATTFLQRSGLPLDPVGERKFAGVNSIAIHSEDADEGEALQSKGDAYLPGPQIGTFNSVDDLAQSPRLSAGLKVSQAEELVLA